MGLSLEPVGETKIRKNLNKLQKAIERLAAFLGMRGFENPVFDFIENNRRNRDLLRRDGEQFLGDIADPFKKIDERIGIEGKH